MGNFSAMTIAARSGAHGGVGVDTMLDGLVQGSFTLLGVIVGFCEGLHKAHATLKAGGVLVKGAPDAKGLPALLEGLQLCPDSDARSLPDACIAHCLAAEPKREAVYTFVDAVFPVAAKRSSKAAAWAPEYARLCALFRQEALRLQLEAPFQDALYGRCLQEYGMVCCMTLAVGVRGQPKPSSQVEDDAEELRGRLRFMAALFKERLLPHVLVQSLAADLAAHTAAGGTAQLHCQPLLAVALVALLQGCVDAYVCGGVTGGRENGGGGGGAPLSNSEAQIRAVGLALLRLQSRVDPLDELHAELEVVHFKLISYASTVHAAAHHQPQQQQPTPPAHLPHHFMHRRSEDILRNARLQGAVRWPSS